MIDLAYHRKYRSKTFSEYIGNEDMKSSLMSMLERDKRYQVILLEGDAGCGKTTMARLLGKEYRCEDRGEKGACGVCQTCLQFDEYILTGDPGHIRDVYEVDGTDANKKADVERVLDEVAQPSFDGSWKVCVFDECHMITQSAQNRLLKIFEEPPESVLFILCTTNPEKMLATITSRCQGRYRVEKPGRDILVPHLARICELENVAYDARALSLVCVAGGFAPRSTLTALEGVVSAKGSVTYENAVEVLRIVAEDNYFKFYGLLLSEPINTLSYVKLIGEIQREFSLKDFMEGLVNFTKRGLYVTNAVNVEALDASEVKKYVKLFGGFNPGAIANILHTIVRITKSSDMESELLLLGYTGITNRTGYVGSEERGRAAASKLAPMVEASASPEAERLEGDNTWQKSLVMTEEEKKDFIADKAKPVTADTLVAFLSGEKVVFDKE